MEANFIRILCALSLAALFCVATCQRHDDAWGYEYCGNKPADVVFLLDSSNSIWRPDFRRQLDFVADVVDMFQVGREATRVGLVTYNDHVNLHFSLKRYDQKRPLLRAIQRVQQDSGYVTATDLALKFTRTYLFRSKGGGRPGVVKVIVVITDGKSRNKLRTLIEASRSKRAGVHLFAIGVGQAVNYGELSRMASSPAQDYFFQVAGYSALDSLKRILAIKTCQATLRPTTTTTTTTSTTTTPSTTTTTTPTTTTTTPTTTTSTSTTTTTTPTTTTSTTTTTPSTTTSTTTTTRPTTTTSTTTTTPMSTTTTTPMSTTTSWVDVVRRECRGKMVDIVFALDNSDAVGHDDFWQMIRFVRDFARGLDVHDNGTRIGVVLYSETVQKGIDLNEHSNLHAFVNHLYKLQMSKGKARPEEMIRYIRTKSFRRSVSRKHAAQVVVVLTASSSSRIHRTKKEALKARHSGLSFVVIGVGANVDDEEMSIIAGVDNTARSNRLYPPPPPLSPSMDNEVSMMMDELRMRDGGEEEGPWDPRPVQHNNNNPRLPSPLTTLPPLPHDPRSPVFRLQEFTELHNILLDAVLQTCYAEPTDNPVADQPCGSRQEADMMFVVDSVNAGKKNTQKALSFMRSIAGDMDIDRDKIQMGLVAPDPCAPQNLRSTTPHPPPSQSFGLNRNKDNVIDSLHTDTSDFASVIRDLRTTAFRHRSGARKGAKRVAVLIVDGNLENPLSTLAEAQRIRDKKGVEIYVISVGTEAPQPEMMMMCDYPTRDHFYHVDSYDRLGDMKDTLVDLLCDEL